MLESFPISIFVGAVLGVLAGLGIGGGTLLVLWLTIVLSEDAGIAAGINLMFFIAAAGAVSIYRWRKGILHFKAVLPGIVAGCIFAVIGSALRYQIDADLARKIFGVLLLVAGIKELLYRPRNDK